MAEKKQNIYVTISLSPEAVECMDDLCREMGGIKRSAVVSYAVTKLAKEQKKAKEKQPW